jgi:hypothetical protein
VQFVDKDPVMSFPDNNRQNILVRYAVLTGLTPLVPIPFVDDQIYGYFMRSLVQSLVASHGKTLPSEEIAMLAAQPSRSCVLGCLASALLYPLKKVLRKVFFFLEWKRAVDTISHTYYQGYLIDVALSEDWLDTHGAAGLSVAINSVLEHTNTSIVSHAIYGVVNQSKGILKGAGDLLTRYLLGTTGAPAQDKAAQAAANVQEAEEAQLDGLTSQLQAAIATLPAEHFLQLQRALAAELAHQR